MSDKKTRCWLYGISILLLTAACNKNKDIKVNNNLLPYVIQDNLYYTLFSTAIDQSGYTNLLSGPGPYTVFVSNDQSFQAAGITDASGFSQIPSFDMFVPYHILNGAVDLNGGPAIHDSVLQTIDSLPLFFSRIIRNGDTVLTINGSRIVHRLTCSNGTVEVVNNLFLSPVSDKVLNAIGGNPSLTYLSAALVRSGFNSVLAGPGPFTFFAPTNSAFQNLGFPSTDSINNTDPAVLAKILSYHLIPDREFTLDYLGAADSTGAYQQTMYNKQTTRISLGPTSNGDTSINIMGAQNGSPSNIISGNIVTLDGVVHIIDQVLLPNN